MLKISQRLLKKPLKQIKRFFILVIGSTVMLVGFVMLVTPGPAVVVIPTGLAILALEFAWARRLLKVAKVYLNSTAKNILNSGAPRRRA